MELGVVDSLMLGVFGLSTLIGVWRGFVYEWMSLAGWLVAYCVSQFFALQVSRYIPIGSDESNLRMAASMVICFVATLFIWALVSNWFRSALHKSALHGTDRLLGALFGAIRALVLLLLLVTLVSMTPLVDYNGWQESQGRAWMEKLIKIIKPWVPAELAIRLP